MAGPTVIRDAAVHLNYGALVVDLSCDAIALEITPSTEEIDVGTMCNPVATEAGRTTFTAVLALLWSPELMAKLQPHVGELGYLTFSPDQSLVPPDFVTFDTRYSALPWGRFELGQRVEVDLPLAVLTTPVWTNA